MGKTSYLGRNAHYMNSYSQYHSQAPFEALYGRKCRSPVCWAELQEIRHEVYCQYKKKPLEFQVGGPCYVQVSRRKGIINLEKRKRLIPLVSEPKFLIKMPPRKNRTLNEIHEQELEDRVMARMEKRFDQFVNQLSDRMDQLMNRRGNRNSRGTDDEQSENPFGEDDDLSSDEESGRRPRRNQREDNRRWESRMRVNITDFAGDTLSPEGFIDWLVMVEEGIRVVATIKTEKGEGWKAKDHELAEDEEVHEETEDSLVYRYIGGLRVQIMDSVNMFDPMTLFDSYQHALAFEKQNRRVGSSSSPAITGASGSSNMDESPTNEFQFHKGLKQGDPLLPFLFILVMENLHISVQRVVDVGMFKGISLGPSLHLSHLFYADDVVFMGQWTSSNIDIIIQVLECFYRASGLRINMNKSMLMGISVANGIVDQIASEIGCKTLKAPFSYLGSKVGGLMSRSQSWSDVINNLTTRLSKWKMKTLSIGGRLTLLKSVLGSMPIYHLSLFKAPLKVLQKIESIRSRFFNGSDLDDRKPIWVKWNNVLASKEKGGLGVSSLYALNQALLFKWVWRFYTQKSSLWSKVIRGIHGDDGKLHKKFNHYHPSIWLDIVHEVRLLKDQGVDLCSFIHKKMGNGSDTSFWEDTWKGELDFKSTFPRIYALESDKNITVADKISNSSLEESFRRSPRSGIEQEQYLKLIASVEDVVLINMQDRWVWSKEGSGEFSVASARRLIDDQRMPYVSTKTRWVTVVPIKVNVHAWKVKIDRLPTRINISRRGMDIDSILCPSCDAAVESVSHVFFSCHIARDVFRLISNWWDFDYIELSSYEDWFDWLLNLRISSNHKKLIEGVCFISWWYIWNFRNKCIFGLKPFSKSSIFDDIVSRSFYWC
ncbi:RNA-directed DNA polymerase, eukaryota, reverse transcriptase zinc-binding domain protein, partial [Tanacetum coccineum]